MRHRKRGRHLGRSSSHRRAMLRNLASSLFLTERDSDFYEGLYQSDGSTKVNAPKQRGRVVTTLHKAKEVRPLVEKCITIARKSLPHQEEAEQYETDAERNSDAWKQWRRSEQWQKWNQAIAPAVTARRRALQLLGNKEAVSILFDEIAPRFADRNGGYTRVLRLASRRLGDAGVQAVIELVGIHDRVTRKSERPAFADDSADESQTDESPVADEESTAAEATSEEATEEQSSNEDKDK